MNQPYPRIGDIWLTEDRNYHMLIVATDHNEATIIYQILEHGGQYKAGSEWIREFCLFYS